ncbi:MAG: TIGR04255 family protein [Methyloglobulus sp.]|nr:TIGR04255 family protein [Methyloglobulus sp.]
MPKTSNRPDYLPDYKNPPLNEVIFGIQFSQPKGYQQIFAGKVWELFREDYPQVQEQLPLQPNFEVFGLPSQGTVISHLNFGAGSLLHNRFWFLTEKGDELIQFQQNRLLHNWRKIDDQSNQYPRFESMIERFKDEINKFQNYVNSFEVQELQINQCEISYINHIVDSGGIKNFSDWLNFIDDEKLILDDFNLRFSEILKDNNEKPIGRLICEASLGITQEAKWMILFTLTVRGAPEVNNVNSALDFIKRGRDSIVLRFSQLTTDMAHKKWEKIK